MTDHMRSGPAFGVTFASPKRQSLDGPILKDDSKVRSEFGDDGRYLDFELPDPLA